MSVEVTVVVPVYGNAATLQELYERLARALAGFRAEVLFVVDASPDDSLAVLHSLRPAPGDAPPPRILELARNYGQHAALCAGFEHAAGEVVVTLDADLQYAPEDIPTFIKAWRSGPDLVCGYRIAREDPLLTRVLPSRLFNCLVRQVSGLSLRDVGCALNAIDAGVLSELPRHGDRRRFLKPLLAELATRMVELPVRATRRDGRSSYTFRRLSGLALDFLVGYSARPFRCAFVVGIALSGLAGFALLGSALSALLGGWTPASPWTVALVVLALGGVQLLTLGLMGEALHRLQLRLEERPFFRVKRWDP